MLITDRKGKLCFQWHLSVYGGGKGEAVGYLWCHVLSGGVGYLWSDVPSRGIGYEGVGY